MIAVLFYIDRTALFIIRIYFIYYHCYYFLCVCVCVVHYMCLSCSIDLVSICANKEIYNIINVYYIIMFAPLYNVYQYYYIIMYRICKCIQCFYYLLYRFIYKAGVALNISYLNTVVIWVIMSSGLSIKLTLFHDGTT